MEADTLKNMEPDPSENFNERMKRFWHYMETKGMNEQWIETAAGELRVIIEALADYYDIVSKDIETMEIGFTRAVWGNRLERIKQIQTKLEESIGYSRDKQIEICMKRKPTKDSDIGEEPMVLIYRRGKAAEQKEKEKGQKDGTQEEGQQARDILQGDCQERDHIRGSTEAGDREADGADQGTENGKN